MPLTFFQSALSAPVNFYVRLRFYIAWWVLLLNAFQQRIHVLVAERFRQYGFFAARHPYSLILFSVVIFLVTSYPLTEISFTEYPPVEFIASSVPVPAWFLGESSSMAVLLPVSVSLTLQPRLNGRIRGPGADSAATCSPVRTVALAADRLVEAIYRTSALPFPYDTICYKPSDGSSVNSHFLPHAGECFFTIPSTSVDSYRQLSLLFDDPSSSGGAVMSNLTISDLGLDLMFGLPFSATGLHSLYSSKHLKHMCAAAVGHTVHFVVFVFFAPVANMSASLTPLTVSLQAKRQNLHDDFLHALSESESSDDATTNNDALRPVFLYFRSWNWMEFTPIFVIYCALLGYIYFSLTKIAMVKSKAGLAFGAVFGIGASFLVVVGICTRLGLTFGYFFTVTDVFPYVVVLNGLENIVIMTTAVTNCRREYKCDVPHCIAGGLELEGFRMVKHVLLAAFVSVIGVLTGVPQIRDFFLMALIGLCTDLLFQLVFFSAVLAIDMKRIELEEQCRGQLQQHRRQRSAGEIVYNSSETAWPWPFISMSTALSTVNADGSTAVRLPLSLAWFHSRRISSLLSIFAIFFITILYLESYQRGFYYQLLVTPLSQAWSSIFKPVTAPFVSHDIATNSSTEAPLIGSAIAPFVSLASSWWRKLPRGHFHKLFSSAYGMSLTHRYLTILPPLELHAHVPLEVSDLTKFAEDASLSTASVLSQMQQSATVTVVPDNVSIDEPISSQVLVVILVILSMSVIVNLSLLLYTCLKRRLRPGIDRRPSQFLSLDFIPARKQPSHVLRVSPLLKFNNFITALSPQLHFIPRHPAGYGAAVHMNGLGGRSCLVAHTTDGLLTVLDSDSGEILGQCMRHPTAVSGDFNELHSSKPETAPCILPCWSLNVAEDLVYVAGSSATVEVYSLIRNDAEIKLSFQNSYNAVSLSPVQNITCLPCKMVAVSFVDGRVEIVQCTSAVDYKMSCVHTLRVRPKVVVAASDNLIAVGSADAAVRILFISSRSISVCNCTILYLPPLNATGNSSVVHRESEEVTALAIDSQEPAICVVGSNSGRIFIYELVPELGMPSHTPPSNSSATASATVLFSYTLRRPLHSSFSSLKNQHYPSDIVSGISRISFDNRICVAINSAGSVCVISCRRNTPFVVGTLHPNPGISLSLPMSPVLDVAVVPISAHGDTPSTSITNSNSSSLFASAHSDGHVYIWAIRDHFTSPAGLSCVAMAQSPVASWPIERLHIVDKYLDNEVNCNTLQLAYFVRNRIYRIDIPLNVNYVS